MNRFMLCLCLLALKLQAQSLDSLIQTGIANNPVFSKLEHKMQAAGLRAASVGYLPPPVVGIEFSQIPVGEVNILNQALSNSISLSQMFPLGGKLAAMEIAERKNFSIIKAEQHMEIRKFVAAVTMQYAAFWGVEKRLILQKELLQILQQAHQALISRYGSSGMVADVAMSEALIASAEGALQGMKAERDALLQSLQILCGLADTVQIVPRDQDVERATVIAGDDGALELRANPELARMRLMQDMKSAESDAYRKELIPDLMVQGMVMRMPKGMILTSGQTMDMLTGMAKTEYMYSLMVSVTLPFAPWSSGGISAKADALNTEAKQYGEEAREMERQMRTALQQKLSTYKSNEVRAKVMAEKSIPALQKSESAAATAFTAGTLTLPQYYEYVKMRVMEQMNYYMALTDMYMSAADIRMMTDAHNSINTMNRIEK